MNVNRFNIFNQIHKGLRAMLYHVALSVQQADFTIAGEGESAIADLEQLLHFFDQHAQMEDRFILSAISRYDVGIAAGFEKEHQEDDRLLKEIHRYISDWKTAGTPDIRNAAGRKIFYRFNEFVAFNLYHMNKEEDILNHALWSYYTDEEILEIMQQIHRALSPHTLFDECRWMIKGMSNTEIIQWIQEINNTAPEEVFQTIVNLAAKELPSERWMVINDALVDAVMVNNE